MDGGRWMASRPFPPTVFVSLAVREPACETSPGPGLMIPMIRKRNGPCSSTSRLPAWFVTGCGLYIVMSRPGLYTCTYSRSTVRQTSTLDPSQLQCSLSEPVPRIPGAAPARPQHSRPARLGVGGQRGSIGRQSRSLQARQLTLHRPVLNPDPALYPSERLSPALAVNNTHRSTSASLRPGTTS